MNNTNRNHKANKHASQIKGARKHAGKKAPKGASGEAGLVTARRKVQLPKRRELSKPNV